MNASRGAEALAVTGLTKAYGHGGDTDERPALAPLTLSVPQGQLVALVGHNGSGKTTFLRMVAGLLDTSGGTISVHGSPRDSMEARAAMAYLSDQPTFYDDLSLIEHLEYVARLHGVTDWHERATHLAEQLGLSDRLDKLPNTFSRGLRQKAAITLAFVRPFSLLLVDEPFVGLDAAGKAALLGLFDEAHASGAALMVATHELSFVSRADRLIALGDGEVRYDGAPGDTDVQQLVFHT
jgi:ABC-type multidrug transport system ATPase subunit